MREIKLSDLYNQNTGAVEYKEGNVHVFVNENSRGGLFIRANIYPDKTRTFTHSVNGLEECRRWIESEVI